MLSVPIVLISASENYNRGSYEHAQIAHIQIVNRADHPERPEFGNYRWIIQDADGAVTEGVIENFNRADGALALLWRVLTSYILAQPDREIALSDSITRIMRAGRKALDDEA